MINAVKDSILPLTPQNVLNVQLDRHPKKEAHPAFVLPVALFQTIIHAHSALLGHFLQILPLLLALCAFLEHSLIHLALSVVTLALKELPLVKEAQNVSGVQRVVMSSTTFAHLVQSDISLPSLTPAHVLNALMVLLLLKEV